MFGLNGFCTTGTQTMLNTGGWSSPWSKVTRIAYSRERNLTPV
jgi:hypothetical protein